MKLRAVDGARLAGLGHDIATPHSIAALDEKLAVVGIGGDPAALMTDQDQIAVAFQFVSRVGDHAAFGRAHAGAFRHGDIDAFVASAARLRAVFGDNASLDRPAEAVAFFLGGHLGLRLVRESFHILFGSVGGSGLAGLKVVVAILLLIGISGSLLLAWLEGLIVLQALGRFSARNAKLLTGDQGGVVREPIEVGNLVRMQAVAAAERKQRFTVSNRVHGGFLREILLSGRIGGDGARLLDAGNPDA